MFENRKPKRAARHPDHIAKLTPSLSVSVWQSHDSDTGNPRMHWDVSRISKDDPSRTFKTLKIESILEFPQYLSRLADGFARTEAVSSELRTELLQFARDMEKLTEKREANGAAEKEKLECGGIRF